VILHLSRLGRIGPDDIAPIGFTQEGIAAALNVRQGTLVKVLQRLKAAEVLTVDRRHVSGVDRRRYVYRLTALGESVARDLRHPTATAPPVGRPNPWRAGPGPAQPRRGEWVAEPVAPLAETPRK
jgi:DNA-binding MarR family transcriptional regulator